MGVLSSQPRRPGFPTSRPPEARGSGSSCALKMKSPRPHLELGLAQVARRGSLGLSSGSRCSFPPLWFSAPLRGCEASLMGQVGLGWGSPKTCFVASSQGTPMSLLQEHTSPRPRQSGLCGWQVSTPSRPCHLGAHATIGHSRGYSWAWKEAQGQLCPSWCPTENKTQGRGQLHPLCSAWQAPALGSMPAPCTHTSRSPVHKADRKARLQGSGLQGLPQKSPLK